MICLLMVERIIVCLMHKHNMFITLKFCGVELDKKENKM